jgi:hypothetical protein
LTPERLGIAFLVVAAAALGAPLAHADGDPVADCIAASDRGIDLRKQGKLVEARQVLATCAAAACGADISNVCRKRIATINAALPSIVFLPKDASGADILGATVTIDGAVTAQALDGRPLSLDPGAHTFRFEAAGQPPLERSFVLIEGAHDRQERVDIGPAPAPRLAGSEGGEPAAAPAPAASGSSRSTIAFVVGGVGILGVAAGSVLGLMASSSWSSSKNDCQSSAACSDHARAVSEHDTASAEATVSTIAFVAGGAALATSAVLLLTAPRSPAGAGTGGGRPAEQQRQPLRLEASLAPGGAGIALAGGFR